MEAAQRPLFLALIVLYIGVMVYLAWFGKRRTAGAIDYFVGGRSIGGTALGLSFFATYASTNSYLGFSGKAHAYGAPWLLLVPFAVGFSLLAWGLVAPRLRELSEELDSITIPDFIGFRFDSPSARFVAAVIVLVASFLYMTAVYKGIGNLFEALLGLSYPASIALVVTIVVIYTSFGGFHSVVRTDVVQASLMVLASVLLFAGISRAAGGLGALSELARSPETETLFRWDAAMPLPILVGIVFASTIKFVVEPRQLSRFFALKDRRQVRRGIVASTLCFLVVFSLLAPIGLLARRLIPEIGDTDRVVPSLLADPQVFSPVVTSILLLAMLSAAMSSLDSVLLVVASTFERDIVGLRRRSIETLGVSRTRAWVVLFALTTAVIALRPPGGIVELTSFSGALYGACFLPAMVLGLYWRRGNGAAVLASFVVGASVLLGWGWTIWRGSMHSVFPAVALSIIVFVTVSMVSTPSASPAVQRFFARRTAPAPGRSQEA